MIERENVKHQAVLKPKKTKKNKPVRKRCKQGGYCQWELNGRYHCNKCKRLKV